MCGFRAHSSSGRRACRLEAGGQLDGHVSCARVRIKKAGDDLTVRSNFAFRETASHAIFVKDPKSQKTKQNERKQLTGALRIITTSERVFYATIPLLRLRQNFSPPNHTLADSKTTVESRRGAITCDPRIAVTRAIADMSRDQAAASRAGKGPPLLDPDPDPDARGAQGSAADRSVASPLRTYYRRGDRAGGGSAEWYDDTATPAAALRDTERINSSRHKSPGEFVMSFPPPPVVEAVATQRPPLRDDASWPWTAVAAPADPRDEYYRDFDGEGRRRYPSERWGLGPAAEFPVNPSSSNWPTWPGTEDGFHGVVDDLYPTRGGVTLESSQDWTVASNRRHDRYRPGSSTHADGKVDDGNFSTRTGRTRSMNRDDLIDKTSSKHAGEESHTTRHPQAEQVMARRKRPCRQNLQERLQTAQESMEQQYPLRRTHESERDAIARLSAGRTATSRMHQIQIRNSASPSKAASESMSVSSADSPVTPSDKTETKTSRYLREIDRRNILARIDSGEKQSELAKEFQVTRAAISNLKKQREVILSRAHGNPLAKHPKKSKLKLGSANQLLQQQQRVTASGSRIVRKSGISGHASLRKNPLLLQVASRPALLHFQRLSDPQSSIREFRRVCRRLMTLVIEEAVAWVETAAFKRKSVKSAATGTARESARKSETSLDSHESRDGCAVMIKPEASLFPTIFESLEPDAPTGVIDFGDFSSSSSFSASLSVGVAASMEVDVDLPPELISSHVYLFHAVVSVGRSVWIAQAVRALVERGAGEALICLVTVAVAAEAVAELQSSFPLVKIVTAHVDHPHVDEFGLNQDERVVDQLAERIARDIGEDEGS
jgi:uracil phosphoribosyltransferase